ncbi:MAG: D-tyrosyl-tRNA(Tyr) deacylase [Polyangiaceae bacterium]|jgi:D-tyrosyl-tRNA(Tyr) deacylase|nr:D-tyrosyl-tRNA(Tyr) deacylase [Polyangiaceae bacterium]
MRAVVQRVTSAQVVSEGELTGKIAAGLCVLVGVGSADRDADATALAEKVVNLRIFEDEAGKMNQSLLEVGGGLLAVSQFTLYGDTSRGRRPSFGGAMEPVRAEALFEGFCSACRALGVSVETGRFRTHMAVSLTNDGPITLILDTEK